MNNIDIDITKNIKTVEKFKCDLLSSVSELYTNLAGIDGDIKERTEILSNIVIISYLLADKLGISASNLDARAINKIKALVLGENTNNDWGDALKLLCKHLDKNRELF